MSFELGNPEFTEQPAQNVSFEPEKTTAQRVGGWVDALNPLLDSFLGNRRDDKEGQGSESVVVKKEKNTINYILVGFLVFVAGVLLYYNYIKK